MGQALYRKYRSKKLSEIVGQEHVTRTLERAIKSGKLSHAYLFTGPRGVGKTSIARILAHEVNDLPYTDESIHLDIIEIDAASNRRIDEIRDLRDKVHIAPTSAKYKVYIIDEVHMLTKEAFNALLKTLEEPPAHVIFILATTEAHKLPDTIISRTQRFTFKPIDDVKAVEHLRHLAKEEGMDIDTEALKLLVEHGRGSFRDSISLLDQIGHSKKSVSLRDVEQLIGIAPEKAIEALVRATLTGTPAEIAESLSGLREQGVTAQQVARQLSAVVRLGLLSQASKLPRSSAQALLSQLLQIPASYDPDAALELALFHANLNAVPVSETPKPATKPTPVTPKQEALKEEVHVEPEPAKIAPVSVAQTAKGDEPGWWKDLLSEIKKHNNTLYGVLRMGQAGFKDKTLTLSFAFGFHAKKIADAQSIAVISKAAETVAGTPITIEVLHDAQAPQRKAEDIAEDSVIADAILPPDSDDLEAITSIFGGGEVLET